MTRKAIFVILILGFAAAWSSCGGSDGDSKYQFGGNWAWTGVVTASNLPGFSIGDMIGDTLIIIQEGNNVTVTYGSIAGELQMKGTCDPKAGTFSASGASTGSLAGISHSITGNGITDNSMSGTWAASIGNMIASGTWTSDLIARASVAEGETRGDMARFLEGITR